MFELPHPLHPAIIHFPIVFILVGTACSIVSLFTENWNVKKWTALFFIVGALAAFAATWSGGKAAHEARPSYPAIKKELHEHAENGERARNLAIAAAVLATMSAALDSKKGTARFAGLATACLAVGASFFVFQAGHLGGDMVYQHGLGTMTEVKSNPAPAP
jgi:uncharacterized membrane protein